MRTPPGCRSRGPLFAAPALAKRLPETGARDAPAESELRAARATVRDVLAGERLPSGDDDRGAVARSLFRVLGYPFEPTDAPADGRRLADYAVFASDADASGALDGRDALDGVPETAVALADVRPPGRPLDARGASDDPRPAETPTHRVHVALREEPVRWGVLTDGETWRLYDDRTSHRLDAYYEVHLPTLLERGGLDAFRYFYLVFRHAAFGDGDGPCFLDDVAAASDEFARELGGDVREHAFEAVRLLAAGFLDAFDREPSDDDLELVREASVVYLYRLLVAFSAEARGWDLAGTGDPGDETGAGDSGDETGAGDSGDETGAGDSGDETGAGDSGDETGAGDRRRSLDSFRRAVAARLDDGPAFGSHGDALWSRLDALFERLDAESPAAAETSPAYDGWLFRTDPEDADERAVRFLATHEVGDRRLARVVDLVSRRQRSGDGEPSFVDYSSLDVRALGRVYEGLLERDLAVADQPLARVDGSKVPVEADDEVAVAAGEPYLTTDSGERTASGSYYTPGYVVEYIVENALDPVVETVETDAESARTDAASARTDAESPGSSDPASATPASLLDLTVLDPASGSGHFLTSAVDYLVRAVVDAQEETAALRGVDAVPREHDVAWVRRRIADRCIYGVDLDPVAVELTRASLWLRASTPGRPAASPGNHLRAGNSLVGLGGDALAESSAPADGDDATPGVTAADGDARRRRGRALANVRTAERFGLETPAGAADRLRAALTDDEAWATLSQTDWFCEAQRRAADDRYLHWPLAFPAVFPPGSDARGFDAVVGNPPWAITTDEPTKRYLRETYEFQSGKPDLYRFFVERCLSLARRTVGMITPNTWFGMDAAESLRRHVLTNGYLDRASLVPLAAFDAVGANMVTFRLDLVDPQDRVDVWVLDESGAATRRRRIDYADLETPPYTVDLQADRDERSVARSLERKTVTLGDVTQFTTGYQLYHTSIHDPSVIENERYHADRPVTDAHVPEIRGRSLSKFHVDPDPDGYVDSSAEFYRLPDARFRRGETVLVREVPAADGIVAAHTDRDLLFPKSVISVVPDGEYDAAVLSGLLNSDAVSFYVRVTGEKSAQQLFPRVSLSTLRRLPVPTASTPVPAASVEAVLSDCGVDDEFRAAVSADATAAADAADLVGRLADRIASATHERADISTCLFDYVDPDDADRPLGDHPAYRRAPGAGDSMLGATAETRPNLKLAAVAVERTGEKLVVEAVARYKPDRPADHDTDRWGYARDGPTPAAELVGVEGPERELLATFVEQVVNEADDSVAGFRAGATKTNSLCDRLEALRVPELSAVREEFERYRVRVRRATVLDARIDCAVTLLNELVYDLYGLTEAERAVVRRSVDDGTLQSSVDD